MAAEVGTQTLLVVIVGSEKPTRGGAISVGNRPRFPAAAADRLSSRSRVVNVTHLTGVKVLRDGRGLVMAAHPIGSNSAMPPSEWNPSSRVYTRSQMTSALRAALIALVLLAILAVIVLF